MSEADQNTTQQASVPLGKVPENRIEPVAAPAAVSASILTNYRRKPGMFDECLTEKGEVRPHYAGFLQTLELMDPGELKRRWENSRRLVNEQGIAYNVYGDVRGMERPWQLDPVPLVIGPQEWRNLERALIQRATLINRILADCYGPQDLIRSGWLPPGLVFAQPDFQRPCHGIRPIRGTFLNFYAADLARSPDGRWWVTSDRTQIPTGAGYALANRLVTSRVLPESFRDCRVHRLAGFFREVQKSLAELAPAGVENPRVVLLTPGPYNETYFEQAYLARYLGYALVEGQDLTVRDDRVYLKTLSGLERVDVILRRVDDEFCDPLELRNDSILGVPGLVDAALAGNVSITNSLGSSLLQSPAFLAFLPGLCRHVLREELKLPSAATWWCGQKSAEKYVLEHLDNLFVKPAFRSRVTGMKPGQKMTKLERAELARHIQFQPHEFVAQEWVDLSSAPSLGEDGASLAPRRVSLRVYLVATETGFSVMPGGLTRVAPVAISHSVSMQKGGASKDTWVLSDNPVPELSLLEPSGHVIDLRRTGNNLPSRMADNFFWLGRYTERADAATRLLRSALLRFSPERGGSGMPFLTPLLETLERQGQLPRHHKQAQSQSQGRSVVQSQQNSEVLEAELLAAIFDPTRDGSLCRIADHLQRLAMFIRDRTSNDLWRALNHLGEPLISPPEGSVLLAADALGVLNKTILGLAAFHGLARENMTRAQGWRFLDMGWRIERAVCLCTFLDCALRSPEADNPSLLEAVLEVADSTITYRSRYNLLPHIVAVYDLVLLDDKNPRSLIFQLNQLVKHFDRLPRGHSNSALIAMLNDCLELVRKLDPRELGNLKSDWHVSETGRAVQTTLRDLPLLSNAMAANYFAHSEISRTGGGVAAMIYNISHRTVYEYTAPVTVSHHAARVEPRALPQQTTERFDLHIEPPPALQKNRMDYFGNHVCSFAIQEVHYRLEITATSRVMVAPVTAPALALSAPWEKVVELFSDPVSPEVVEPYQFVFDSPLLRVSPELAAYARESFPPGTPLLVAVKDLNRRIFKDFKYDPVATTVATPLEEVLAKRRGVCQDFAHLAIASLRSLGIPARYVSGYLRTHPPEGKKRLVGSDASHAWFSVYCPSTGWLDFDPTNNILPAEEHITIAFGRDYTDVSPVTGVITGGGSHQVKVAVDVEAVETTTVDERDGVKGN